MFGRSRKQKKYSNKDVDFFISIIDSMPPPLPFSHVKSGNSILFRPHRLLDDWTYSFSYCTTTKTWSSRTADDVKILGEMQSFHLLPTLLTELAIYHSVLITNLISTLEDGADESRKLEIIAETQPGAIAFLPLNDTAEIAQLLISARIDAINFSLAFFRGLVKSMTRGQRADHDFQDLHLDFVSQILPLLALTAETLESANIEQQLVTEGVRADWQVLSAWALENGGSPDGEQNRG